MPLTEKRVVTAKPKDKVYQLSDGDGLSLMIYPNGKKGWRFRYRFDGVPKMISFGSYPERGLKDARNDRHEARQKVAAGIDPGAERKAAKVEKSAETVEVETFELVAREWHELKCCKEVSAGHADTTMKRLENYVFPWLGKMPIREVGAPELLSVLRRVDAKGALETAHRLRSICGQVFRYAIATGRADRDPAADLRGALPSVTKRHHAAVTEPAEVAKLLRAIDEYNGGVITRAALQLAPLTFVRPGELRHAEWVEIDFEAAEWSIPAGKMKMKVAHLVPLSTQAIQVLKELLPITGDGRYVFPSALSIKRPMSENAVLAALRRMGYAKDEMTGHGFRAMARTMLDEVLQFPPAIIEHQLAHTVKDALGRAYNRTQHLEDRRKMMQVWADYLDGLKNGGAKVIPLRKQERGV